MTNEEVQNIIEINDICKINDQGSNFRFLGYKSCRWKTLHVNDFLCNVCKGYMIFESDNGQILTSCHSFSNSEGNHSDVEIVQKNIILPEELFEL